MLTDGEVQPEFITFLYQLTEGAAGRSYGLNVARLVDIPVPILHTAARKARELENTVNARRYSKHEYTYKSYHEGSYFIFSPDVSQVNRRTICGSAFFVLERLKTPL